MFQFVSSFTRPLPMICGCSRELTTSSSRFIANRNHPSKITGSSRLSRMRPAIITVRLEISKIPKGAMQQSSAPRVFSGASANTRKLMCRSCLKGIA